MSFFASLYRVGDQPELGMWLLYGTIVILAIVTYQLGFARKLPPLKTAVIYVLLALGCSILTFFAVFLPVGEGLVVAIVVLGIYKIRLSQEKKRREA
ncbi:YlaH-like family protein [Bacillus fonticola]|uniref:YlaH-like family protein n=1 Tax=Bacillus fonticola TaxID=2728853 RepID=UPI0018850924|nr:YlaH-like family protein [Bacillus fonticola]